MLLLIHLIVRFGLKIRILYRMLGADYRAEIIPTPLGGAGGGYDLRLNIQQFTHLFANRFVEIQQIIPSILKKWPYIILVILKKRRFPIRTHQRIPMQMPPVAVIANTNIFDKLRIESSCVPLVASDVPSSGEVRVGN